jgi:CRP-like cAMP-binding protein
MALFHTENKRMASAVATMDSILIVILSFSIHEMTDKNPELLKRLQDIIAERIIKNKMIENSLKKNNF